MQSLSCQFVTEVIKGIEILMNSVATWQDSGLTILSARVQVPFKLEILFLIWVDIACIPSVIHKKWGNFLCEPLVGQIIVENSLWYRTGFPCYGKSWEYMML